MVVLYINRLCIFECMSLDSFAASLHKFGLLFDKNSRIN